jgi:hypothetical protein
MLGNGPSEVLRYYLYVAVKIILEVPWNFQHLTGSPWLRLQRLSL